MKHSNRPLRFDAFISYSHGADAPIAAALEREIKRFAKPFYRRSSSAIFRDQTNLSASPHLWNEIAVHLDAAAHLILVASPEAAASRWVRKELCAWLTRGACTDPGDFDPAAVDAERKGRLLFAVTAGAVVWDDASHDFDWSTTTALPPMLARVFDGEPLWVDFRGARGSTAPLDRSNAEFMSAAARIAARVRNLALDTLIGLDYREHRRTLRVVAGVAMLLLVLLIAAIIATWSYVQTNRDLEIRQAEMLTSQGTLIGAVPTDQPLAAADMTVIEDAMKGFGLPPPPGGALDYSHLAMVLYMRGLAAFEQLGRESPETTELLGRLRWRVPRIQRAWIQTEEVGEIAVSADGMLVAITSGNRARVLERTSGRVVADLTHPTAVHVVRFSPDGRRVATGSTDRWLRLWDIQSGTHVPLELPLRECEPDDDPDGMQPRCDESEHAITLLEFSPDGRFIAAAHGDIGNTATDEVYVWNGADSNAIPLEASDRLTRLVFSAKGTFLAAGTLDGQVSLFRAGTFEPVGQWASLSEQRIKTVNSLAFTADESLLAAGSNDGAIRTWKTADTSVGRVLAGQNVITGIAFRTDGQTLAVASEDRTITRYAMNADGTLDVRAQQTITLPAVPSRLAYGPGDAFLIAAVGDGSIRAWSMPDGTEILAARSPSGRFALTPQDGGLLIADAARRVVALKLDEQGSARYVARPPGRDPYSEQHLDPVEEILIDHDGVGDVARWVSAETGAVVAEAEVMSPRTGEGFSARNGVFITPSGPDSEQVDVVRMRNGRVERATLKPTPRGRPMGVDGRGSRVALPLDESAIGVWDTASGQLLGTYRFTPVRDANGSSTEPWALALDEDGTRLAMVDHLRRLHVWSDAAAPPLVLKGSDDFFEVAFAPGTGEVVASDNDRIVVYDEGSEVRCEIAHTPFFTNIVMSRSGDMVVVAGGGKSVLRASVHRLTPGCPAQAAVDLGMSEPIHVAVGAAPVFAVSTGSERQANRIHVIDMMSGRRIAIIPLTPTADPSWIAFARDDRHVVTANRSGFRFWPWRITDIIEDARSRVAAKE